MGHWDDLDQLSPESLLSRIMKHIGANPFDPLHGPSHDR